MANWIARSAVSSQCPTARMGSVLLALAVCAACASTMQVTQVDPKSHTTTVKKYAPYFGTRTILIPGRVGLDLVVDLEKKMIPGLYQVQQSLGALGPGDVDATGLFTAYVWNMSSEPQILNLSSMATAGQMLPGAAIVVQVKPDSYEKVVLGRVGIFNYATDLKIQISYLSDGAAIERTLHARRLTQAEIEQSYEQWKGRRRNVPEYFPD
jgi:hypothetical protein